MIEGFARRPARVVGLTMFVVVWTLTTHGKYSASGDEPHYLVVTRSLYADHDIEVGNNYAANDGNLIGHDGLVAGAHARPGRDGRVLPVHDLGVSIALVPVYAIAKPIADLMSERMLARFRMTRGLFLYSLITLAVLAMTATACGLLARSLSRTVTPSRAIVSTLLVGLSPPLLLHSYLIFPEAFGFAAMCAVACWCVQDRPTFRGTWPLVIMLGLLPWCHRKYSFLVFACAAVMVIRHSRFWRERSSSDRIVLALLFLAPQAAMHVWTMDTWGTLGGPQMLDSLPFTLSGVPRGFLGLLFDRQYGLVANAPWYLLLPAAWTLAGRRAAVFLLPVIALDLPMAGFVVWWGGFSTAARYLVPLLPFCAVAVAWALENPVFRRFVYAGAVLQIPITAYAWQHPRTLWPAEGGETNPLLDALGPIGRAYEHLLPRLSGNESLVPAVVVALLAVGLNVALIWFVRARGGAASPESVQSRIGR
jgi:hypothetical protein